MEYSRHVIVAPERLDDTCYPLKLFLAGSIDMGQAVDWQSEVIKKLCYMPVTVMSPRRRDWNASWEQDINNPPFREQVEWELEHLEIADFVFFHFDPVGKAPITLLELGLVTSQDKSIVSCPQGYWRRGNVEIVCARYGIPFFSNFNDAFAALFKKIDAAERARNGFYKG